jgi:transposase-like protein
MYIKHCKLLRKEQSRLIKFFVAGVTARTAADLVGVHRNLERKEGGKMPVFGILKRGGKVYTHVIPDTK